MASPRLYPSPQAVYHSSTSSLVQTPRFAASSYAPHHMLGCAARATLASFPQVSLCFLPPWSWYPLRLAAAVLQARAHQPRRGARSRVAYCRPAANAIHDGTYNIHPPTAGSPQRSLTSRLWSPHCSMYIRARNTSTMTSAFRLRPRPRPRPRPRTSGRASDTTTTAAAACPSKVRHCFVLHLRIHAAARIRHTPAPS